MYRSKKLNKYIGDIKSQIYGQSSIGDHPDFRVKYTGSFNDKKKEWFTDVDIKVIIDTPRLGDQLPMIRRIAKSLRDRDDFIYGKFRVGFEDYYFRQKYTLNYFKKMCKEGRITEEKLEQIKNFFHPVYNHRGLKKNLKDVFEYNMSYTSFMRDDKKLKRFINRNNTFVIRYIFGYGNKYVLVDLGIITKNKYSRFVETISEDDIYVESFYTSGWYYHYLKRLGSRLLSSGQIKKGKEIKGKIREQEKFISQNYQKQCQAIIDDDREWLSKLEMDLEKHFKNLAIKYHRQMEKRK